MNVTPEQVKAHGLSADEWDRATRILEREPNLTELGVIAAMWSEHCSYKSSRVHLRRLPSEVQGFADDAAPGRVLVGPGENAGVVSIGDGLAVVFKMESHNHPSFIEPHQGAATGVGGILRDVFTMGARPIASLNALRFGRPGDARTRHLVTGAVGGIGGYGNAIGVPTVGGDLAFHESYAGNCLVNAMTLGLVKADAVFLGRAVGVGNPVLYVGSRTGKDGIKGAIMASDSFDETALKKRPTVQVGDPFTGKRLLEACLEIFAQGLVLGIQDMGAAGLTSSSFEMAGREGTGIDLDLDDVPLRVADMSAYEIMLSESQERMLLVCRPEDIGAIASIFHRWDLECAVVGRVTATGRVRATRHGQLQLDLPARPLSEEAPRYERPLAPPADLEARWVVPPVPLEGDVGAALLSLVGSPNLASRAFVSRQYDSMVRLGTVAGPGSDAALVRILGTDKAVALTVDVNSRFVGLDPRSGATHAVAEGVRNLACVGARPIGLTDCLNFGNPQRPEVMWSFSEAVDGIAAASRALGAPVVSGNVSLYNETDGAGILPTPMIAVVGYREGGAPPPGPAFAGEDDEVAVIGALRGVSVGGGEWLYSLHGLTQGRPAPVDLDAEARASGACRELVMAGLLVSAHDVSDGGLLVALAECAGCHGSAVRMGADLSLPSDEPAREALFGEAGARFVVSFDPEAAAAVAAVAERWGAPLTRLGRTGGDRLRVTVGSVGVDVGLEALFEAWDTGLERALRVGRFG